MPIEHTHQITVRSDSGGSIVGRGYEVGNAEVVLNRSLAASQTDVQVPCAVVGNNIQSLVLLSDKDLLVEVNSGSSPAKTISLKAGVPYVWGVSQGAFTNPLAGITVANLFLTSTAACRFRARFLVS